MVATGWGKSGSDHGCWQNLLEKTKSCKRELSDWNKKTFKNAAKELSRVKRDLTDLLNQPGGIMDWERVKALKEEAKQLWNQEEKFWGQRSRIKWLKWGDKNSRFFHATTVQRRERNRIQRIKDDNGDWKEGQEEVPQVIVDYYQSLYTASETQNVDDCVQNILSRITKETNEDLSRPVLDEEIKKAAFSLGALKTLGGDGLNGLFFQQHWDVVGADVCEAIKSFFSEGNIPEEVNVTLIVLTPKSKRPEQVSEYRPISCCNFLLKIIT